MADTVVIRTLREQLANPEAIARDAFGLLRSICALVNAESAATAENADPRVQELVLRALENRTRFGPASIVLDGLVRRLGLFPYLDPETLGLADTIAYEYHRPLNMGDENWTGPRY